jgi:amidohydrolase
MTLPEHDDTTLQEIIRLRHELHREPELSNHEQATADRVRRFIQTYQPDEIITGIGGHGLAARFGPPAGGLTVLVRADLDAVPIQEMGSAPYCSSRDGVAHLCGHDGHMAIVAGLAPALAARRPPSGRVWLLFQPAEETGEGAERMARDPALDRIAPDLVLGIHNLPGEPLGRPVLRAGTFAAGSAGAIISLEGSTSQAAHPELGRSPARAVASLIQTLETLGQRITAPATFAFATVVHARLGDVAFGTTPGRAVVMATIRSDSEEAMSELRQGVAETARAEASREGLSHQLSWTEVFPVTRNHEAVIRRIERAAQGCGLEPIPLAEPVRWSEDFGWFTRRWPGAMIGIGAGADCQPLHGPTYDFPDRMIQPATLLLGRIIDDALTTT